MPSPWCLVSVSVLMRRVRRARPAPPRPPDRASTSIQRTRGSRRNHRSWRTANCRVRVTISSTRSSSDSVAVEVLEQLLVAERLARRSASMPARRSARDLVDEPGVDHRLHPLLDPLGEHRRGPPQADLHDRRRRVGVEPRPERAERPAAADAHLERAHDATRFVGSIFAAATGSSATSRAWSGRRPVRSASARARPGPSGHSPGRSRSSITTRW